MIKALVFDFDGLILDTETPEFTSWCEVYASFDQELEIALWAEAIGTRNGFDPYAHLELVTGEIVDREAIRETRRRRNAEMIAAAAVMPGVVECVDAATMLGLGLGVASSSDRSWVEGHLGRLGLLERFGALSCGDEVKLPKPHPELYLRTLERLGVEARESLAFEDSPNGVTAARAAGLYCVAVPNPLTVQLDLSAADLVLPSLAAISLPALLDSLNA